MANKKSAYCCQSCGAVHFKWVGRCVDCGEWNSLVEEFAEGGNSHFTRLDEDKTSKNSSPKNLRKADLVSLDGEAKNFARIKTNLIRRNSN